MHFVLNTIFDKIDFFSDFYFDAIHIGLNGSMGVYITAILNLSFGTSRSLFLYINKCSQLAIILSYLAVKRWFHRVAPDIASWNAGFTIGSQH